MQEQIAIGPSKATPREAMSGQRLAALLALVGAKTMDVEPLRARTRLPPSAFAELLDWLQRESLVDVVSSLKGEEVRSYVKLTEAGERVLMAILERTCELPEIR